MSVLKADPAALTVDTGSYFYGSGLFFPQFRGNASARFFADSNYSAWGLTYRDFVAFTSPTDPLGSDGLLAYIADIRVRSPAIPLPVATNVHFVGTPFEDWIATHSVISLADGRRAAFICLLDPTWLPPAIRVRTFGYRRARG
jgi:hypothetical protein